MSAEPKTQDKPEPAKAPAFPLPQAEGSKAAATTTSKPPVGSAPVPAFVIDRLVQCGLQTGEGRAFWDGYTSDREPFIAGAGYQIRVQPGIALPSPEAQELYAARQKAGTLG